MGGDRTVKPDNAHYRLKLALGFLEECRQDVSSQRWRSAVDNAQLAVENAAKSVLALVAPVGRTHNTAPLIRQAIATQLFPQKYQTEIQRLAECAETLDYNVHVQTDYGDEMEGLTPWDLFDEKDARDSMQTANEAVGLANTIVRSILHD
jgi:HEPN domain-containing protein